MVEPKTAVFTIAEVDLGAALKLWEQLEECCPD
jgi:hypothetical protein